MSITITRIWKLPQQVGDSALRLWGLFDWQLLSPVHWHCCISSGVWWTLTWRCFPLRWALRCHWPNCHKQEEEVTFRSRSTGDITHLLIIHLCTWCWGPVLEAHVGSSRGWTWHWCSGTDPDWSPRTPPPLHQQITERWIIKLITTKTWNSFDLLARNTHLNLGPGSDPAFWETRSVDMRHNVSDKYEAAVKRFSLYWLNKQEKIRWLMNLHVFMLS